MKSMTRVTTGLILWVVICLSNAMAAEVALFGPHLIERGTGKPISETHTFSVPDPSGQYTLQIKNGDDQGNNRVSSLSLSINGEKQASQDDFSQTVNLVEKAVLLQQVNRLSIKANGGPGSFVEITILGDDGGAVVTPSATLVIDPAIIEAGQTATLNWQTANADSVSLEPGFGVVVPNGSQQVSPEQSTTYNLTAIRGTEEVVSSVKLTVTAVPLPPDVSVDISPAVITPGEAATLNWQSSNADTVTIEPGIGNVAATGSMPVSPAETTTYLVTATRDQQQASAQATLQVEALPTGPYLTFDDIDGQTLNGAHLGRSRVTISGTVHGELGPEIGVTVNGGVAEVNGQRFIANHVPLQEGWNTLSVIAVDAAGQRVEASVELFASIPLVPISLRAERYNGAAPFETTLTIDTDLTLIVADTSLDCLGGAPTTVTPGEAMAHGVAFSAPGLYDCLATVTDEAGQIYRDRVGIQVWSVEQLDQMLQAKWAAMKDAMVNSDAASAVNQFTHHSREAFRQQFESLRSHLPQMAAGMGPISLIEVKEGRALYDMRTTRDGTEYSFQVEMIRDMDGVWRIWTF